MKDQQGQEPVQSGEEWKGQNLAAGCADGSLVVLSTADNDLTFEKFVTRASAKRARCLSVTYQNRHTVVAGFADSTIRVYDVRKSSLLRNMSLGAGQPGGPREVLVWAVNCLPNGNIVSGDSTGEVRFWDGKTYSLLQRVAGHESDVLDIVTSQDGHTVLSG
ncbi:U3 small nucleolar RNA-associated protein, partial [Cryomyces antarcticus]